MNKFGGNKEQMSWFSANSIKLNFFPQPTKTSFLQNFTPETRVNLTQNV